MAINYGEMSATINCTSWNVNGWVPEYSFCLAKVHVFDYDMLNCDMQ